MNTQTEPQTRDVSLDVARGVLMAYMVIVIHGVFWLALLPQAPASILLFEMPPIFMITGAAHFLAEREKPTPYVTYLLKRSSRILIPYWAYALVCAAITLALGAEPIATLLDWLNPVTAGARHSTITLNWHLWFVPLFLGVTALMPFITRVKINAPLWLLAIGAAFVTHAADLLDTTPVGAIQMIVFYALWAGFGFALAADPERFKPRDYAIVLALSLAALLVLAFTSPASLNMQANKFPPTAIFFVFSCVWMSVFLLILPRLNRAWIASLARSPLIKPFMIAGYSIYLWQGLGYTAALTLGRWANLNAFIVWPIAVAITVALGALASPLERIRLRR
jgi:fucose 4-O-acetylase-like acetyltransferase